MPPLYGGGRTRLVRRPLYVLETRLTVFRMRVRETYFGGVTRQNPPYFGGVLYTMDSRVGVTARRRAVGPDEGELVACLVRFHTPYYREGVGHSPIEPNAESSSSPGSSAQLPRAGTRKTKREVIVPRAPTVVGAAYHSPLLAGSPAGPPYVVGIVRDFVRVVKGACGTSWAQGRLAST
jgi:hypothetical protein